MKLKIGFIWASIFLLLTVSHCYKGHGLSPNPQDSNFTGIRGHITFVGTWPDSTKEVRVAVLDKYPLGVTHPDSLMGFVLRHLVTFSDTIPRFVQSYDYELALEPGTYEWVLVAWFPDIPLYLLGVKELGAYYRNPGASIPTPIRVLPGVVVEGIDIVADFNNVSREIPFFKIRGKR